MSPRRPLGDQNGARRAPKESPRATTMHLRIDVRKRSPKREAQGGTVNVCLTHFSSPNQSTIDKQIDAKIDTEKVTKINQKTSRRRSPKWSKYGRVLDSLCWNDFVKSLFSFWKTQLVDNRCVFCRCSAKPGGKHFDLWAKLAPTASKSHKMNSRTCQVTKICRRSAKLSAEHFDLWTNLAPTASNLHQKWACGPARWQNEAQTRSWNRQHYQNGAKR